ncbi:hypothetical protein TSOC_008966 [Tetrabaena socialis]|uniref:EF-hand domain-containing protein n=1 Tax=Tetrabaena socialis TaxID=47790 RepID=A0A2J7ZXB7_9CHLO|nr:hypothetical protein TSOC_008966 [Tetrabaena socialis]|eukprot:PNH04907.1 hypothetical protein TSOC_008966 [Tetrabaena socialis]
MAAAAAARLAAAPGGMLRHNVLYGAYGNGSDTTATSGGSTAAPAGGGRAGGGRGGTGPGTGPYIPPAPAPAPASLLGRGTPPHARATPPDLSLFSRPSQQSSHPHDYDYIGPPDSPGQPGAGTGGGSPRAVRPSESSMHRLSGGEGPVAAAARGVAALTAAVAAPVGGGGGGVDMGLVERKLRGLFWLRRPQLLIWVSHLNFLQNSLSLTLCIYYLFTYGKGTSILHVEDRLLYIWVPLLGANFAFMLYIGWVVVPLYTLVSTTCTRNPRTLQARGAGGDKKVDFEEFVVFMVFAFFDGNGNSRVEIPDIRKTARRVKLALSEAEVSAMMDLADPDGDRKIGLRQFFKLFQVGRKEGRRTGGRGAWRGVEDGPHPGPHPSPHPGPSPLPPISRAPSGSGLVVGKSRLSRVAGAASGGGAGPEAAAAGPAASTPPPAEGDANANGNGGSLPRFASGGGRGSDPGSPVPSGPRMDFAPGGLAAAATAAAAAAAASRGSGAGRARAGPEPGELTRHDGLGGRLE